MVLVCPENFAFRPTAALIDVRKQLAVADAASSPGSPRSATSAGGLPPGPHLRPRPGRGRQPTRPRDELTGALRPGATPATHPTAWRPASCASSAATRPRARLHRRARPAGPRGARRRRHRSPRRSAWPTAPAPRRRTRPRSAALLRHAARPRCGTGGSSEERAHDRSLHARCAARCTRRRSRARRASSPTVRHRHLSRPAAGAHPARLAGRGRRAAGRDGRHRARRPHAARRAAAAQPRPAVRLRRRPRRGSCLPTSTSFAVPTEAVAADRSRDVRYRFTDAPQILGAEPGGVDFLRLLGPVHPVPQHRRALPGARRRCRCSGRWLTFFADAAEQPGSSLLLRRHRGARPALGDRAEQRWRTPTSRRCSAGSTRPPGMTGARRRWRPRTRSLCPPAGPATDPEFDNEVLAPLIAAYERGRRRERAVERARPRRCGRSCGRPGT